MNHRRHFSLLIVRGDGRRVLRVGVPRRVVAGLFTVLALATIALGFVVHDWWQLRHRSAGSASLRDELAEEQATIASFNARVAELRREVSSWRALHARIWEPFGPDRPPRGGTTGIGGGHATPPDRPGLRPSPSDELRRLAESVAEEGESLRALDRLIARAKQALASLPSRWPIRGAVNSEFGTRSSPWTSSAEFHSGIDIGAERGTLVLAPSAGTVAFAGTHPDYGLTIILDHGHDIRTLYGHLSRLRVMEGRHVERGSELALSGNTGRSSGPHLHYEIQVKGKAVNPRAYLWD